MGRPFLPIQLLVLITRAAQITVARPGLLAVRAQRRPLTLAPDHVRFRPVTAVSPEEDAARRAQPLHHFTLRQVAAVSAFFVTGVQVALIHHTHETRTPTKQAQPPDNATS